jgi:hypothetical protein
MAPSKVEQVELERPSIRTAFIRIVGDSPLIVHRWSEKTKREMLDKHMGKAEKGREVKDPQSQYEDTIYYLENGDHGFPSSAFKQAAVRAGKLLGIAMTDTKTMFHVNGTVEQELATIEGTPRMREDIVRVSNGSPDIRYRAEYPEWSTVIAVHYNPQIATLEKIVSLIEHGGFGVGVGEWRPEKNGQFGRYHVEGVE